MSSMAVCSGWRRWKTRAAWLGLAVLAVGVAASSPAVSGQDGGQPARAIRLSYIEGNVTLSMAGPDQATPAVVNTPLFEGATLATGDDGRAEIQFEDGSIARLSPDTVLTLSQLRGQGSSGEAEMVVQNGLAYCELQGNGQIGAVRVRFADSVVTASGFTVLRVKMDTPPGELAVFSGNARLERGNGALALDLHGGESITLHPGSPNDYALAEAVEPDSWDTWNSDRDQALSAEQSAQTAATSNLGDNNNPAWDELNANGSWYDVPDQGYVWSPYEAASADFDPYGNGNWMWTPGYGYVWASAYTWGYLPYQCGMWNYYDGFGWGWAPGMNGCHPWWGMGYYRGPNLGQTPHGYLPLRRPPSGHPVRAFDRVIRVQRGPVQAMGAPPARDRDTPVTIAGHAVQPLRPLPSRSGYTRPASGFTNHTVPAYAQPSNGAEPNRSVYVIRRPGYVPAPRASGGQGFGWQAPGGQNPGVQRPGNEIRGVQSNPPPSSGAPSPERFRGPSPAPNRNPPPASHNPPPSSHSSSGGGSSSGGHSSSSSSGNHR